MEPEPELPLEVLAALLAAVDPYVPVLLVALDVEPEPELPLEVLAALLAAVDPYVPVLLVALVVEPVVLPVVFAALLAAAAAEPEPV